MTDQNRQGLRPELGPVLDCQFDPTGGRRAAELTADQVTELALQMRANMARTPSAHPFAAAVDESDAAGVPVRVYRPPAESAGGALPVVIFFHGGGWIGGNLETNDEACRVLAVRAGCVVVSVDYRLAPEHSYPSALDDGMTVCQWIDAQGPAWGADARRVVVAGSSSGGNLAVGLGIRLAALARPAIGQLLVYPVLDHEMCTPSYHDLAAGWGLTRSQMDLFWRCYLAGRDPAVPEISPLRWADLAAMPPTIVLTAGFDPLRDEGELFARRLADHGVPVALRRYPGQLHGFVGWPDITPDCHHALAELGDCLTLLLATGRPGWAAGPSS